MTGSRAEYGLLRWLMHDIESDPRLDLEVAVTGMHLAPEFGLTYREIEKDGFAISRKVDIGLGGDAPGDVARAVGRGVAGFAEAFEELRPDIVVVLGDRFETFAAAQAAMFARIPIAHLNGGELTEGMIDEAIRHSLTKMSHFHFVATDTYRHRVIQMGEDPARVWTVGSTGVDAIMRLELLSKSELADALSFSLDRPYFVVTYHPVTLLKDDGIISLISALDRFAGHQIIFTGVNADAGHGEIARQIERFVQRDPSRVLAVKSLGQLRYLSALKYADAVVGNSSSGIIEAPALGVPTVNIGDRQLGRLRADSIIDVPAETPRIISAIERALTDEFRARARSAKQLFGDGEASRRVARILAECEIENVLMKHFVDAPVVPATLS